MATLQFQTDATLDALCASAAKAAVTQYSDRELKANALSLSVGIWDPKTDRVRYGGYRAEVGTYPASVVKLFYLNYLANQLQSGAIEHSAEIERAAKDMIVDSSNDATGFVVDLVTGTTSGPELSGSALREWTAKRQIVNRWYEGRGYLGNNVCQKTWGEGPYGRERASYGAKFENRNSLTTFSCLRLFAEIANGSSLEPVGGISSQARNWNSWMLGFLTRTDPADAQASEYIGSVLPAGAKLRSKAGWTSTVRHDAAWVSMPDGRELILVIFTSGRFPAATPAIIPSIAKTLLEAR